MAKLALLLVFVCFQFSKSEELSAQKQVRDLEDPLYDEYDGSDEQSSPGSEFNSDWLRTPTVRVGPEDPVYDEYDGSDEQSSPGSEFNSDWLRKPTVRVGSEDPLYDEYDGSDEQSSPGSEFNSDWLRKKFSREGALNETDSNVQSILDKLIALAEMIADYSDEDYSYDWDDDDTYWDIINERISNALYREAQKKANHETHEYAELLSAVRPSNLRYDEGGNNGLHPVKRFTSV